MCLLPVLAFGQNGGVLAGTPTITNSRGEPVPYATVAICTSNPGTAPSTPCGSVGNLAAISTDLTLGTQCMNNVSPPSAISGAGCTNPGTSDGLGNVVAFASPGVYYCEYYGGSIVQPIVIPCFFASGGSGGVSSGLVPIANCTAAGTVVDETVQLSTQTSGGVTSVCATIGALSSTTVIGVCNSSCGNSGTAQVAVQNFQNAIFDNSATANHYVAPSSSVAGFLTDTGATSGTPPTGTIETCGIVGTPNSGGAGNPASVMLSCLALFGGGPSGTGTVGLCPTGTTPGAIGYYPTIPGTNIACDASFITDAHGHVTAVSLGLTGSGAGYIYQVQGSAPSISALNATYWYAATSVSASWGCSWPSSIGSANQVIAIASVTGQNCTTAWTTPASGVSLTATTPIVITPSPTTGTGVISCPTCATGSSITTQTNGTNNSSQSTLNIENGSTSNGLQITFSNPSAGNVQPALTGPLPTFSQVPQPSAPTLTVNGSTGSTTITYCVQALQDTAGSYGTQCSNTQTVTNANATLTSSNSVTLSGYQLSTNGTSVRCWNIYRTATNGTSPTTTGLIASCVGTSYTDTGQAGNSASAPNTNTTVLLATPLPLPGCPVAVGGLAGTVDAPNCTTNALDDEFGELPSVGNIADTNNTQWKWVNQGSCAATLSNGAVQLQCPTNSGSDNLACLMQAVPGSTPYAYAGWMDMNSQQPNSLIYRGGVAWYDGTKFLLVGSEIDANSTSNTGKLEVDEYTSASTLSSQVAATAIFNTSTNGYYFAIKNDGTNLKLYTSPDGVFYVLQNSQTIGSFITPTKIGICLSSLTGTNQVGFDYFRSIPTSRLP